MNSAAACCKAKPPSPNVDKEFFPCMKEIILLKSGEIALKGLNRSTFEDIMAKNARRRLQPLGEFKIWHAQSTTYVQPLTEGVDMDEAVRRLQTVFGIVAVTKSCVVEKDFSVICPAAAEYFAEQLSAARTFKVEAKRSDKSFPMKSPEISRELGGYLLSPLPSSQSQGGTARDHHHRRNSGTGRLSPRRSAARRGRHSRRHRRAGHAAAVRWH